MAKIRRKSPKLSRTSYLANCWLTPQNDRKNWFIIGGLDMCTLHTTGSALKIQFFVLWGLIMTKLHDFSYFVNCRSNKNDWLLQIIYPIYTLLPHYSIISLPHTCSIYTKLYTPYIYHSGNQKCPKNVLFCFFGPNVMKFQKFPCHENYMSFKLADLSKWPKDPSFY